MSHRLQSILSQVALAFLVLSFLPLGRAAVQGSASSNSDPTFPSSESGARTVAENTAAGVGIGAPVAASHSNGDTRACTLGGAAPFTIVAATGRLQAPAALNFEVKATHSVTVSVSDQTDAAASADNSIDATVAVTNVDEPGTVILAPERPRAGVSVTVTDNDGAVVVVGATILNTPEGNSTAGYDVKLGAQPTSNVVISLTVSGSSDVTVDTDRRTSGNQDRLTFTSSNWNTGQIVGVKAAEDADAINDTASITHAVVDSESADEYDAAPNVALAVTVADNDAGITLSRAELAVTEGGSGTYTVKLNGLPASNVVISVTAGGSSDVTADTDTRTVGDQNTLTFTTADWSTPQTVTVSAVQDDDAANDASTLTHAVVDAGSADEYDGVLNVALAVTVTDDDAGVTVVAADPVTVAEGRTGSYTVVLNAQPASDVVISATAGGSADVTVDTDSTTAGNQGRLTFTTANWNTAQTVTVTAREDDDAVDDAAAIAHAAVDAESADEYDGVAVAGVSVTVTDNDEAVVVVGATILNTPEGNSTAGYDVKLGAQPTSNVVISLTVSGSSDVTVDTDRRTSGNQDRLTFTSSNWNTGQIVGVKAAEDADAINDTASITHAVVDSESADEYDAAPDVALAVTVTDDDTAVTVVATDPVTVAEGRTGSYTVVLIVQPASDVVISVTLSGSADVTVDTDSTLAGNQGRLTFTTANWNTAQTVTVTAREDDDAVDDAAAIAHAVVDAESSDEYDGVAVAGVTVTVNDNETAGVTVVAADPVTVTEGNTATYTMKLNSQPASDVVITVSSDNPDVTVSPTRLTFTTANWNMVKTVTVTAGQDGDTANDTATLTHSATSTDATYQGVTITSVAVAVTDNDSTPPPTTGGGRRGAPRNRSPEFTDGSATDRSTTENTPAGADIGEPVAARDREDDKLTYSLRGADSESFDIDPATGKLLTKAPLDYEAKDSYSVIVSVSDGKSSSGSDNDSRDDSINVTIAVENVDEPGEVALSSHQPQVAVALTATLTDPDGGLAGIVWLWERSSDQADWTEIGGARTESYTPVIGDLNSYLRVTASYADGYGRGKSAGAVTGDPVLINTIPRFPSVDGGGTMAVEVEEGSGDAASGGVGEPVAAADPDGDTLTYSLSGDDAGSFEIDASTGRLWSRAPLDYETQAVYSLVVSVRDSRDFNGDPDTAVDASVTMTVAVINVDEAGMLTLLSSEPRVGVPLAARLTDPDGVVGEVVWKWERSRDGNPWSSSWRTISGAESAAYAPVDADAGYYLRVTACYEDGHEPDKSRQAISGSAVEENTGPVFSDAPAGVLERSVAENTGEVVGDPVAATSPDGGALTHALGGADAALFAIDSGTGQIRVGAATVLDYEADENAYEVTVIAMDSSGASATVAVTIRVTDVDLGPYDTDKNEAIARDEALAAVVDYFRGVISKEETTAVIQLYSAS